MKQHFWQKLIENWCDKLGRYGLTIPYIVGAYRLFIPNFRVKDLIEEINSNKVERKVILSFCDDLDELILGYHKNNYPPINQLKSMGSLLILNDELEKINDLSELIIELEEKFNDKIMNKQFSKDIENHNWSDFNTTEENEIKEIYDNIS